ncbi:MAG: hypothetical protein HYW01_11025 [Deltaproteobacteria bacterium]|nr:hypothetical protein [Deltaproteobacteria bacterium]
MSKIAVVTEAIAVTDFTASNSQYEGFHIVQTSIQCVVPQGDNEYCKCHQHPVERYVFPLSYKIDNREWNDEIRQANKRVGDYMKPHKPRLPQITMTIRYELVGTKDAPQYLIHYYHPLFN